MSFVVSPLAAFLGGSESAIRLLLGQLASVPLGLAYRRYLRRKEDWVQHAYMAAGGVAVAWWAVGQDAVVHGLVSCVANFAIVK